MYMRSRGKLTRHLIWVGLAGLLLVLSPSSARWIAANLIGFALGGFFVLWERYGARLERAALADRSVT